MPSQQWVSVAEAARELGVSERTIWNRIRRGKLETRQGESGRKEVLLVTADDTEGGPETFQDRFQSYQEASTRQIQIASTAVVLAEKHAETYQQELKRVRWSARAAWCLVFAGAVAGGGVAWYIAQQAGVVNVARAEATVMNRQAQDAHKERDLARTQADLVRKDAREARQEARQARQDADKARMEAAEASRRLQKALADLEATRWELADMDNAFDAGLANEQSSAIVASRPEDAQEQLESLRKAFRAAKGGATTRPVGKDD